MTNPLALADALSACVQTYPQLSEDEPGGYCTDTDMLMDQAAALLRTQHADIERKDALLRQALTYLEESRTLEPINLDWVKGARRAVAAAITKELSQ